MKKYVLAALTNLIFVMPAMTAEGVVNVESNHSVVETADRFQSDFTESIHSR